MHLNCISPIQCMHLPIVHRFDLGCFLFLCLASNRHGMVQCGMAWCGIAWNGMVWYGMHLFSPSPHCASTNRVSDRCIPPSLLPSGPCIRVHQSSLLSCPLHLNVPCICLCLESTIPLVHLLNIPFSLTTCHPSIHLHTYPLSESLFSLFLFFSCLESIPSPCPCPCPCLYMHG